jgi:membrane protein implicated in regulation of membrane protease activity
MNDNDLLAFFETLNHWHWWIAALGFLVLELLMPGVFFLWVGVAAAITGLVALIAPDLGWQTDFVVFAALSLVSAVLGRRFWKPSQTATDDPTLNQRGAQYIGQVFVLETALENGHGRVKIGDGSWLVEGADLPAGARVKVTGVNGARLKVEAA